MQDNQNFFEKRGAEEQFSPHLKPTACRKKYVSKREVNPSAHLDVVEMGPQRHQDTSVGCGESLRPICLSPPGVLGDTFLTVDRCISLSVISISLPCFIFLHSTIYAFLIDLYMLCIPAPQLTCKFHEDRGFYLYLEWCCLNSV